MAAPRWLNLELLDSTRDPLAERPYRVEWEDGAVAEGRTDAAGRLSLPVPDGARRAALVVQYRRFELELDALAPAESVEGVQERLNQLNFFAGAVDGVHGPRTANALKMFQRAFGLPETGERDAATLARLDREHGA